MFRLYVAFVIAFVTFGSGRELHAQIDKVETFTIRAGTLEHIPLPGFGWIFRSEAGEVEVYGTVKSILETTGPVPRNLPGLEEIGFKLENDVTYLYRSAAGFRAPSVVGTVAHAEHPGKNIKSKIFLNSVGEKFELLITRPVEVLRADLVVGENVRTLWSLRHAKRVDGK